MKTINEFLKESSKDFNNIKPLGQFQVLFGTLMAIMFLLVGSDIDKKFIGAMVMMVYAQVGSIQKKQEDKK